MMKHINRSDTEEFYTNERCHILELLVLALRFVTSGVGIEC